MEEEHIIGQENNQTYMKVNLKVEKDMAEVLFGGLMEVGMKASSNKECKVDMDAYIEKEEINNMKVLGIMECSMVKVFNFLKMVNVLKVHSNKINSMVMEFFTKMIP